MVRSGRQPRSTAPPRSGRSTPGADRAPTAAPGPSWPGTELRVPIAGQGSVPVDATAVVVNLTVTNTQNFGYLTAFPCDEPRPFTSAGNYEADDTRALQVMVGLGIGRPLLLQPRRPSTSSIDVSGWFAGTDGTRAVPLTGTRVARLPRRHRRLGRRPSRPTPRRASTRRSPGRCRSAQAAVLDVVATGVDRCGRAGSRSTRAVAPVPAGVRRSTPTAGVEATNVAVVTPRVRTGSSASSAPSATDLVIDLSGVVRARRRAAVTSTVTGAGDRRSPRSAPDGHDYGVHCQAGSNTLDRHPHRRAGQPPSR